MTASERYGVFIATLLTRNQMYEEAYKVIFTIVVITLGGILFSLFWVEFILNKSITTYRGTEPSYERSTRGRFIGSCESRDGR